MNTNGSEPKSSKSLDQILLEELAKMESRKKYRIKLRYDNYGDDEEFAIDTETYKANHNRGR